jgi:hypothetical protein
MRETHEAESYMYLKAVKATMILVPLLGIQFVVFPWRPSNKVLGKIYDYLMHSLIHFQVRKPTVCLFNDLFSLWIHLTLKPMILHFIAYSLQFNRSNQNSERNLFFKTLGSAFHACFPFIPEPSYCPHTGIWSHIKQLSGLPFINKCDSGVLRSNEFAQKCPCLLFCHPTFVKQIPGIHP